MLLSDGFLLTAKNRLTSSEGLTESDLRRSVSDCYFALFHQVCETLASVIQGDEELAITREAWLRLYRFPEHGLVARQCDDDRISELPKEIQQFASQFKAMKVHREDADYDALKQFEASKVRSILQQVESVLAGFKRTDPQSRLRFAVLVSMKKRQP